MAISRKQKQDIVGDLKEHLDATEVIILTDYRGLSVPDQQSLRRQLRDSATDYKIVKNTLTKIALRELNRPVPEDVLIGPTALALFKEDIAGPAKTLIDFANNHADFEIKGGILGDRIIEASDLEDLAELPPKDVLLAQLLGIIQGPASTFVGVLEAPAGELVRTLQAPMRELAQTIQAYVDSQQSAA